jgi:hypothetical protein
MTCLVCGAAGLLPGQMCGDSVCIPCVESTNDDSLDGGAAR